MAKLKTGRHTSALKEARKTEKRTARNAATKSKIRTLAKKVEAAVKAKDSDAAKKALNVAFSEWDKAKKILTFLLDKGADIHKNAAANQKARLSKLVASL